MDIHGALCQARQALSDPSAAENTGAWAEVLAFGLAAHEHGEKPWGTFFGPMGSMTDGITDEIRWSSSRSLLRMWASITT